MAYDIFTQPTQSTIPISLFGEAATSGISAGHALPSTITAAIRGVQQGVDKGQEVYANYQTAQANKQTIESNQIKLDRERANADVLTEAQRADANARIEEAGARQEEAVSSQQLAPLKQQAASSKLTTGVQQAELEQTRIKQGLEFNKIMTYGDTAQRWEAVNSGRFDDYISSRPNLKEDAVRSLYNATDIDKVVPGGKDTIEDWYTKSKVRDEYLKDYEVKLRKYNTSLDQLPSVKNISTLTNRLGVPESEVPFNVKLVESGKFQVDETGSKLLLDPLTGKPIPASNWTPNGKWLAFKKDPITDEIVDPTIILSDLGDDDNNKIVSVAVNKREIDGTNLRSTQDKAVEANKQRRQQASGVQTTTATIQDTEDISKVTLTKSGFTPTESAVITTNFSTMNAKSLEKLTPSLQKVKELSRRFVTMDRANRVASITEKTNLFNTTADRIINEEIQEDPDIKDMFTDDQVKEYNRSVDRTFASFAATKTGYVEEATMPFRVKDSTELYKVQRHKVIIDALENTFTKFQDAERARRTAKVRRMQSTAQNTSLLNAILGR